ncbi:MAG: HAMP domain-containing sensor histidine kinase [Henriciella sp.]|nr:HAMP domain-containing sensor histidine kinase [Henriciella sp.]
MTTQHPSRPRFRWHESLSFRILICVIAAVLIVEAVIFVPSASRFRTEWMRDRVQAARVAALALEAAPSRMVSEELADDLLMRAAVLSVAELSVDMREQILAPTVPFAGPTLMVNLTEMQGMTRFNATMGTFFAPEDRLLVIRAPGSAPGRVLEVVVPEAPLRAEMTIFGRNILILSLIISAAVGALLYLMLFLMVVRPMRRVTQSVEQFRDDPGSWTRRLSPTPRRDEIGRAQNALSDMESAVSESFRQQERLAQLGEAVAKINHDLRNSLSTAQLVSDVLSRSEDPRVVKTLPRLERALERAIRLTSDTLKYGRSSAPDANITALRLFDTVEEAAGEVLAAQPGITFDNQVGLQDTALADPDHLHRICANLIRNAAEAMEGEGAITASFEGTALKIADTGPGLPEAARNNLFKAFAGSTRRDGTGLGLALSRDLARATGGDLKLDQTGDTGTVFRIELPVGE